MDQLTAPILDRKDIRIKALRDVLVQIADLDCDCAVAYTAACALDNDDLMAGWETSLKARL